MGGGGREIGIALGTKNAEVLIGWLSPKEGEVRCRKKSVFWWEECSGDRWRGMLA